VSNNKSQILTTLESSLEPFKEAFNRAAGAYKFVAILSPT
jgi:hypothetical protein